MKDKLVRAFIADGEALLYAVSTTEMVENARLVHKTSPVATAALGRLISGTLLMGATMKNEEDSLSVSINGGGPIGNLVAAMHGDKKIKAYVDNPYVDLPPRADGKLDVGGVVGRDGFFTAVKSYGLKEPYVGRTELISGEIAEDFANYYLNSEQQPNAVALGVLISNDYHVLSAGGVCIMPMPGCSDEVITKFEEKMNSIKDITAKLREYDDLEDMVVGLFSDLGGYKILQTESPEYGCDCSKEKLRSVIVSLGKEEVAEILSEQDNIELTCHFCHSSYVFYDYEVSELFNSISGDD